VESGELREDRTEEVGVGTMGALVEGQPSRTAMVAGERILTAAGSWSAGGCALPGR
jgi:hypothetical protein